jgi:hypothetical protein
MARYTVVGLSEMGDKTTVWFRQVDAPTPEGAIWEVEIQAIDFGNGVPPDLVDYQVLAIIEGWPVTHLPGREGV